jgi:hypothetical protein
VTYPVWITVEDEIMQSAIIKLRYEDGLFVPLAPVAGLDDGEILEFRIPGLEVVYLCETDRLAALDRGLVVRLDPDAPLDGETDSLDA